jgi:hypothetical protein
LAHFTLGIKAKIVELKSSIPISAITEINQPPKGFTLAVKAKKEFFFNVSFYGLDLASRQKQGLASTWEANLQPLGLMLL